MPVERCGCSVLLGDLIIIVQVFWKVDMEPARGATYGSGFVLVLAILLFDLHSTRETIMAFRIKFRPVLCVVAMHRSDVYGLSASQTALNGKGRQD